jgi:predicted DNA-binding transcriptional regulator YafY
VHHDEGSGRGSVRFGQQLGQDRERGPLDLGLDAVRAGSEVIALDAAPGHLDRGVGAQELLDKGHAPHAREFGVPEAFDLARYWQAYLADFRAHRHRADAVVRLAPAAVARLPEARILAGPASGWVRAVVPIESVEQACREFLALGPDIEVLVPAALRTRLAACARATAALYA